MKKYYQIRHRFFLVFMSFFLFMTGCSQQSSSLKDSSENEYPDSAIHELDYHSLEYNQKKYVYNQKITTVLYAGVDSDTELITYNRYTIAPRADTIELVILDNYHKVIKILAISRDTITEVERYTMNGNSRGTYDTQIGYAYTYGDGGKVSCTNLVQSVSELLGGIPIQEYVITNNASMPALNTMVGNVSVTVPTDDMVMVFPEFYEGARITLNDENVETFVRWRDIAIPFSNNSRMKRQQAFASGFLQKFKQKISEDPEGVWKEIESMSPYIQTSITKSQYLKFADRINNLTFSEADYYYLVGEDIQGVQYDEVHLDKETLLKTILDLFYIEDGESE